MPPSVNNLNPAEDIFRCPLSSNALKRSDIEKIAAKRNSLYPNKEGNTFKSSNQKKCVKETCDLIIQRNNAGDVRACPNICVITPHGQASFKSRQHGMALVDNGALQNEENVNVRNDSGFGSGGFYIYKPQYDCNNELEKLERNSEELSMCYFYFGALSSTEARNILRKMPNGTFLVRDSSDSRYLYSLSLKTERGATSVRILYNNGLFQFDSDERIRDKLPCFESVLALVDFHVMISQDGSNKSWRWEENSGRKNMTVTLKEPLKSAVPSLAHLSRVKINHCLEDVYLPHLSVDKLPLTNELKEYLKVYPYRV
ncbi:unnamed protein product [Lymnaea stagnalis]|uniref:Cytokine-inducible SH2-containing protein n=1 Tax=Lymnaea stagnalis TaxID=6523 RepID=A0AAV2I9Y6_LYMST